MAKKLQVGCDSPRHQHHADGMPSNFKCIGFTPVCPHCLYPSIHYYSDLVTRCSSELFLTCSNEDCGHRWVAMVTAVRTISASKMPDKDVRLVQIKGQFLSSIN